MISKPAIPALSSISIINSFVTGFGNTLASILPALVNEFIAVGVLYFINMIEQYGCKVIEPSTILPSRQIYLASNAIVVTALVALYS
ncbi:MAG: hypothetical protein WCP08_14715, partial [Prolixibacteraceae bacterium]